MMWTARPLLLGLPLAFGLLIAVAAVARGQSRVETDPPARTVPAPSDPKVKARIKRDLENLTSNYPEIAKAAEDDLLQIGLSAVGALEAASVNVPPEERGTIARLLDKILLHTHVVTDALGNAIVGGKLTLKNGPQRVTVTPNELGQVTLPSSINGSCMARIDHPDYGAAEMYCRLSAPSRKPTKAFLCFPLVKRGSPEYERTLRGKVQDADGRPIADVQISCSEVRTQAEGLITPSVSAPALSASDGSFVFYPSRITYEDRLLVEKVSPNCVYYFQAMPPTDGEFFPSSGKQRNDKPVVVTLERPTKSYNLKFEERGGGFVTDPKRLQGISLVYYKDASRSVGLPGSYVMAGRAKLLPGKYQARLEELNYVPVEVSADSPTELLFRRPQPLKLYGRTVHGVDGSPMAGVLLLGYQSTADPNQSPRNLAELTEEHWKALHALKAPLPFQSAEAQAALKPIAGMYGLTAVTKSDAQGRFELVDDPDRPMYGLLAVEENRLPMTVNKSLLKFANNRADAGDVPLFPAAKVQVMPVVDGGKRVSVMPAWKLETEGQPEWFARFQNADDRAQRRFECEKWMTINVSQRIFVPANLQLKVEFRAPYNDEVTLSSPPDTLRLEVGQTHDLGKISFSPSASLTVLVLDEQNKPLEGVSLRKFADGGWQVPHATNSAGLATLFVAPNAAVRLGIVELGAPEKGPLKFDVDQASLGGKPYVISLTKEQAEKLSKPKPLPTQ